MRFFTSYYANIKNIPNDYFLVSASGGITNWIYDSVDVWDKSLAPSLSIFNEYKETRDWERYVFRFKAERLPKIDWDKKIESWREKANELGKKLDNIVILCYETSDEFCHRHILGESLERTFGIAVEEYGHSYKIKKDYRVLENSAGNVLF